MQKKGSFLFDLVAKFFLVIFLCATHAKLFYWLDPVFIDEEMQKFSFAIFNEKTIQSIAFAFLFGLMTVYILDNRKESPLFKYFVIAIALLDGMAVQWLFNENFKDYWKVAFASTHYTIYTIFIILMFGFTKQKKDASKNQIKSIVENKSFSPNSVRLNNYEKVAAMLQENANANAKEIAKDLHINPSTVYRIIKKIEGDE
jgi:hypothetical protein